MTQELQSLSTLFHKRIFRIPDYQRGYAWRQEQLEDFWEDLVNLQEGRYHYTGLISLKESNRETGRLCENDRWLLELGYTLCQVVDGQQRLTTFSILVNTLISFLKNLPMNRQKVDDEIFLGFESLASIRAQYLYRERPPQKLVRSYMFGYEEDDPSYDYLRHVVFEEPHSGTIVETYYTNNLNRAIEFFKVNVESLYLNEGIHGIEFLYKKLTQQLKFNLHIIGDDYDVFVAFETMNNRGKKLTNLELLKNRLVYLTSLFDDRQLDETDKGKLRANINNAWKEVYYQLGRNQEHPLSDDEFLRAHWVTYFQYTRRKGDDYIRFLLDRFSPKNVFEKLPVTISWGELDPLSDFEDADDEILEDLQGKYMAMRSKIAPSDINDYVNSLKDLARYWYLSFFPQSELSLSEDEKIWLDKLNRIGIGYFRPLVVSALASSGKTCEGDRLELYKAIERFIFLCFRLAMFNGSFKSSDYYNKARGILKEALSLQSVSEDLNGTIDGVKNSVFENFLARTNQRFDAGGGFYRWMHLRYFLYEYELDLETRYGIPKLRWDVFTKSERDKVSIEHILPQTPTNEYWQKQFCQYSDDEKKILAGSLGNLLPLSQSINSSLQNDSFPDKKMPAEGRRGYVHGSHSEIEVSREEDWDADRILKRGMILLDFLERRWGLTLTAEDKMELLHICFVDESQ